MQFKTQLSDLNEALSLVSIVKPGVDPSGSAGYLFVARGDTCYVYSEDEHQKSRVSFPIRDLDAEGAFILPTKAVPPLTYLEGEVLLTSAVEEGVHTVSYETGEHATQKLVTLDPRSLQALDSDFESAETVNAFHPALLKDALTQSRSFLADLKGNAKDAHKCLQIFDTSKPEWEKGNGVMYAASGFTASFFYCPDLKDHGLTLHGARVPLLVSFLSKSTGMVTLKASKTSTYFVNEAGQVIGWADVVTQAKKFDYYSFKKDTHILRIPRALFVNTLEYVRKSLDSKEDRVRFQYDHTKKTVRILASSNGMETTSNPVGVVPLDASDSTEEHPVHGGDLSKTESFSCNFNINFLMDLIAPCKSHLVELRAHAFPTKPDAFLFRTIESYKLDETGKAVETSEGKVFECQVTRLSTSKS